MRTSTQPPNLLLCGRIGKMSAQADAGSRMPQPMSYMPFFPKANKPSLGVNLLLRIYTLCIYAAFLRGKSQQMSVNPVKSLLTVYPTRRHLLQAPACPELLLTLCCPMRKELHPESWTAARSPAYVAGCQLLKAASHERPHQVNNR